MFKFASLIAVIVGLAIAGASNAAIVTPTAVTGSSGGQGFGYPDGNLPRIMDLSGIDTSADVNDPSQWVANSNAWQLEWQSHTLLAGAANSKIGWVALDLGSVLSQLDQLYIWNERENNTRNTKLYNVYYASTPTVGLPGEPGQQALSADVGASGGAGDYDFASGGWTQIGSTADMSDRFDAGEGTIANDVVALGGISARYIAIEMLSNDGDANRVGLAEVVITQIPEPSSLALLGLGGLLIARRRRG